VMRAEGDHLRVLRSMPQHPTPRQRKEARFREPLSSRRNLS
jgi:hypothetical protein